LGVGPVREGPLNRREEFGKTHFGGSNGVDITEVIHYVPAL
jgi:hypothetical protein